MRGHARNQLALDLGRGGRTMPPQPAPEELLQALADLLLEALGKQDKKIPADREVRDASEDHA
jgi:hypothetical protein